jgi:anti-sigma B factor antagonist
MTPANFGLEAVPEQGDHVRVRVLGEVDLTTAPQVEAALQMEMQAGRKVLLDLEQLDFMDSTGIGVVVGAIRDAGANDWDLTISSKLSPEVRRLFTITGLLPLIQSVAADASPE